MSFQLEFSENAIKDIQFFKDAGNKSVLKKLSTLLNEISEHPFQGTGKPEPLKYELYGSWSRRINKEHRLIYRIENETAFILSVKGHYD